MRTVSSNDQAACAGGSAHNSGYSLIGSLPRPLETYIADQGAARVFSTFWILEPYDLSKSTAFGPSWQFAMDRPFAFQFGQVSPDGRWLAYGSNETGQTEVYVIPFAPGSPAAGKWQLSTAGGQQPCWRADGRELFFANSGKLMAVDVNTNAKSFEAGTPH
jgi:hypothetical protein